MKVENQVKVENEPVSKGTPLSSRESESGKPSESESGKRTCVERHTSPKPCPTCKADKDVLRFGTPERKEINNGLKSCYILKLCLQSSAEQHLCHHDNILVESSQHNHHNDILVESSPAVLELVSTG